MAWITMISKTGSKISVPESVYENMYKENEFYSVLEESKPSPKIKEEKQQEEVVKDEHAEIPKPVGDETKPVRKSPAKTVS